MTPQQKKIVEMSLEEFLEKKGEVRELESLRSGDDNNKKVRTSYYIKMMEKLIWMISLLDDLYVVEEREDGFFLKKK